jgi:hypothetical protein
VKGEEDYKCYLWQVEWRSHMQEIKEIFVLRHFSYNVNLEVEKNKQANKKWSHFQSPVVFVPGGRIWADS